MPMVLPPMLAAPGPAVLLHCAAVLRQQTELKQTLLDWRLQKHLPSLPDKQILAIPGVPVVPPRYTSSILIVKEPKGTERAIRGLN